MLTLTTFLYRFDSEAHERNPPKQVPQYTSQRLCLFRHSHATLRVPSESCIDQNLASLLWIVRIVDRYFRIMPELISCVDHQTTATSGAVTIEEYIECVVVVDQVCNCNTEVLVVERRTEVVHTNVEESDIGSFCDLEVRISATFVVLDLVDMGWDQVIGDHIDNLQLQIRENSLGRCIDLEDISIDLYGIEIVVEFVSNKLFTVSEPDELERSASHRMLIVVLSDIANITPDMHGQYRNLSKGGCDERRVGVLQVETDDRVANELDRIDWLDECCKVAVLLCHEGFVGVLDICSGDWSPVVEDHTTPERNIDSGIIDDFPTSCGPRSRSHIDRKAYELIVDQSEVSPVIYTPCHEWVEVRDVHVACNYRYSTICQWFHDHR